MAEGSLTKKLFQNYLRSLYIELTPEEIEWVKSRLSSVTNTSWCCVVREPRHVKGLLSYYLVCKKCPDYVYTSSSELVERRFDEELSVQELIDFKGIVIIRHSSAYMRNKLMFETLLHIVAERQYKEKETIVVSDIAKDSGEYIYYDHDRVMKYIPCNILGQSSKLIQSSIPKSTQSPVQVKPAATSARSKEKFSRPLANIAKASKLSTEQQAKDRSKLIEESAKNAI